MTDTPTSLLSRIDLLRYEVALTAHYIDQYDIKLLGVESLNAWLSHLGKLAGDLQQLLHEYDAQPKALEE